MLDRKKIYERNEKDVTGHRRNQANPSSVVLVNPDGGKERVS